MSKVVKSMESARDVAKGTMEMWVIFDTDEEVTEAREWMKARQKVKNLTPMTAEESAARHARAMIQIAEKYGIKS